MRLITGLQTDSWTVIAPEEKEFSFNEMNLRGRANVQINSDYNLTMKAEKFIGDKTALLLVKQLQVCILLHVNFAWLFRPY